MSQHAATFQRLTLFTETGERKYLSAAERARFLAALPILDCPRERTFCEMLFWTGCRPSEALALTPANIDLDGAVVIVRSLKKRGKRKGRHFRPIPVPRAFMRRLDAVHDLRAAQAGPDSADHERLWPFSRTTAWERTRRVMRAAGISGARACANGLRHAYGVHAALASVPETRIKKWLGHDDLATTEIYLDMAAPEDRTIARRMWRAEPKLSWQSEVERRPHG